MANSSENKDNAYSAKPPIFDGEKFEYRKDRMKSFLLGFDMDLWNLVVDGYEEPKDTEGKIIPRSKMTDVKPGIFNENIITIIVPVSV